MIDNGYKSFIFLIIAGGSTHPLPSLTVHETSSCRPSSGGNSGSSMHQGEKVLNSRSSRSSSPTTESKFASLSQQLSTPNNGRNWFQF